MEDNLPAQICRECRLQLEKFYIFRSKSIESDNYLRKSLSETDTCQDSYNFLKRYENNFNEHDYEQPAKRQKISTELSEIECDAIEKTVQTALQKNGYNGRFVLKVEDIDEYGLRKVRVIKDNGSVILMKLKMPEKSAFKRRGPEVTGELQLVIKKCEKIENLQDKLMRSAMRIEKTVLGIHEKVQVQMGEINYEITEVGRDENSPFYFPISHLTELWRLNNRLADPEVKAQLTEEMNKIESPIGCKISGKIFRTVIEKSLLCQICWSGRIKDGQKYGMYGYCLFA